MRSLSLCVIWMVFTLLAVVGAIIQPPSPAAHHLRARRALWPARLYRRSSRRQSRSNVGYVPKETTRQFPFAGVLARANPMRGHRANNLQVHEANPLTQALRRAHKAGFRQSRRKIAIPRLRQTDKPFRHRISIHRLKTDTPTSFSQDATYTNHRAA